MAIAAPLLLGLAILLTFLAYLALQRAMKAWLHPLLQWIFAPRQSFWKRVLTWPVQEIGKGLAAVERYVSAALGHAFYASASALAHFLTALAWVHELPDLAFERFAKATLDAFTYVRNVAIPSLIEVVLKPVRAEAHLAKIEADTALTTLTGISTEVASGLRSLPWGAPAGITNRFAAWWNAFEHIWDQVFKHIVPRLDLIQYTTLPRVAGDVQDIFDDLYKSGRDSLPRIRTRLKTVEGELSNIFDDPLAWLAGLLTSVAGIAMLTAVLTRILPEVFCRNTRGLNRAVCGLDESLFGQLLAGTLVLALVMDPREVARAGQLVTEGMADIWRATALR